MRIVAILVLPVMMAAAPAPDSAAAKPVCQNDNLQNAEQRKVPRGPHKLAAEPPAKQILTVLRTVDGCTQPVVVREDVGAPARP